ncbi:MAG: hypothetical protein WC100_03405 [Sterolibacterium sp.]
METAAAVETSEVQAESTPVAPVSTTKRHRVEDSSTPPTQEQIDSAEADRLAELDIQEPTDEEIPADTEIEGEEPEIEEKKTDAFPPELLARARRLGFSDEDAREYGSPKLLDRTLARLETTTPAAVKPAEETQTPKEQAAAAEAWKLELGDDHDPEVKKAIESLHAYHDQRYQALNRDLSQAMAFIHQQQSDRFVARMGDHFTALGDEVKGLFSTVKADDMKPEERENFHKIVEEMAVIEAGYEKFKKKLPDERVLVQMAIRNLFPGNAKSAAREEISGAIKKQKSQTIGRPMQNTGTPKIDPTNKAIKSAARILAPFRGGDEEA